LVSRPTCPSRSRASTTSIPPILRTRPTSSSKTPCSTSSRRARRGATSTEQREQPLGIGGCGRLVLVPEIHVDRLRDRADAIGPGFQLRLRVRRLAEAEVAKRRLVLEVVHPHGACLGKPGLDPLP